MTPDPNEAMRSACHRMAEHVLRLSVTGNRCKWLRQEIAKELSSSDFIDRMAAQYKKEYPYAEVPTEYLADMLKSFDQHTQEAD